MATTSKYDDSIDYLITMENEAVAEVDTLRMRLNRLLLIASDRDQEVVQLRQMIAKMDAHVNHLQTLLELVEVEDVDVEAINE